jgi:transaldolase
MSLPWHKEHSMNNVKALNSFGQSVWLDYIRRDLLIDGTLRRLVEEDGVSGVTSNPSIFQKAITESNYYTSTIASSANDRSLMVEPLYEVLAMEDVRQAADILYPVFKSTKGRDGYVSLEVSPQLARDIKGTIEAARHLWSSVDRPNLMIKIPATEEGLIAFEEVLADGINVNVTLLFSLERYEQVALRYINALERRHAVGLGVNHCASVASFFLSRIDMAVDRQIEARLTAKTTPALRSLLEGLRGQAAVASARLAYQRWKKLFSGLRWEALEAAGAKRQRLLWASTSTKNPAYDDLLYVQSLIGPETVNTLPPATLDALRDHGKPRLRLETGIEQAAGTLQALQRLGIDMDRVTDRLLEEGLDLFDVAYKGLLVAIESERRRLVA